MANTASARKRIRQTERRTARNKARRSRVHSAVKAVEVALAKGEKDTATALLKTAQPELQRAAAKGVVHPNKAARKISRLSKRIKTLSATQ